MLILKLTTDEEESHHRGPWICLLGLEPASPEAHGCAECGNHNKFRVLSPNEDTEALRGYVTCRKSHLACCCARLPTQICLTPNVSPLDHPAALHEVARWDEEGLKLHHYRLLLPFKYHDHCGQHTPLESTFDHHVGAL